ncbi:L,D-transpeptidase family protein [Lichenihabitans sp. Uapishka_5]|uniref:L,D-transpeptidase family protein n=1 Tax=Lichenihabitans sp. Uapishka_5 TaxID=3037302 RepID=UPI0029E7E7AD|nr:L,D-transpeptidase family protein [Lichenihabitans sp. Uapishka_5]MDX7950438.1 L,D-transpeptidase family protein [Lichenihabitans sp. Uapishka_5]
MRVALLPGERFRGRLIAGQSVIPCVIGPGGITRRKREGDGATPAGSFALHHVLVRLDRAPRPLTGLPCRRIRPKDGWCDDPLAGCYNRAVTLPAAVGHEHLWRDDRLYDAVVVIDYNLRPARKMKGSAIFLHVQASPVRPTAGCVAVTAPDLRRLLLRIGPATRILIG